MQSEQITELAAALAKAQGVMENAPMNRTNPHFRSRYADLASILDAIRKPLSANGLGVTQQTEFSNGTALVRTTLMHTSGQWISAEWPLPTGGRPQEMGSALTYARRYSLSALVGISGDDDDDAEAAEAGKQNVANGQNAPTITHDQVADLRKLMGEVGADEAKFLSYMGLETLEGMPMAKYGAAIVMLEKKRAK